MFKSRIFVDLGETQPKEESLNNYEEIFLALSNQNITLEDALDQMYSKLVKNVKEKREKIIKKCKKIIDEQFEDIHKIYPNITKDEALVICTYTYEDDKKQELSPYSILNQNLVSNERRKGINNISKYFFLLLKNLRKLTVNIKKNQELYRAINRKVPTEPDEKKAKLYLL